MKINKIIKIFLIILPVLCSAESEKDSKYAIVDNHALNTPKSAEKSMGSLSKHLTSPFKRDVDKIRAIYRWITNNIDYDIDGFFSGDYGDLSPEGVLGNRRAVCDGYAGLFENLAKNAGLEVVKIAGYSKGYGYEPGASLTTPNHSWNAVKLDGHWYLLDATWGSGYMDENRNYVRWFQEHYFLTPPEKFIYDHFPENNQWQLLDKPISKQEFESLVYLRPAFFKNGLDLISHKKSVINVGKKVEIKLFAGNNALLLSQLIKDNQILNESLSFSQKQGDEFYVYAVFPKPGKYTLRLFTKFKGDPGVYHWALDYKIKISEGEGGKIGFPQKYAAFNDYDCYLIIPLEGFLRTASNQIFKLNVPAAEKVAVVINDKWYQLQYRGDIFVGKVPISTGKINVYAKFPGNSEYSGLLEYDTYY